MAEERRVGERVTYTTRMLANEEIPRKVRYTQIVKILKASTKPMTAKQVAIEMFRKNLVPSDERNWCAPRLTELSKNGIVEPVDKVYCDFSGKLVCRYKLREEKKQ